MFNDRVVAATLVAGLLLSTHGARNSPQSSPTPITWTFDRLDMVGGVAPRVEGHPKVVDTPIGKAIEFNGVDDALWIDQHPLAGAKTFTCEAIFRPDGGAAEQRWFHLAERDPKTGGLASVRMPTRASCSSCASSMAISGISMPSSTAPATTRR